MAKGKGKHTESSSEGSESEHEGEHTESEGEEDKLTAEDVKVEKEELDKHAEIHEKDLKKSLKETEKARTVNVHLNLEFALDAEGKESPDGLNQKIISLAKYFPKVNVALASEKPIERSQMGRITKVTVKQQVSTAPVSLEFSLNGAKLPETVGIQYDHPGSEKPLSCHWFCGPNSRMTTSDIIEVFKARENAAVESKMDTLALSEKEITSNIITHNNGFVSLMGEDHPIAVQYRKVKEITGKWKGDDLLQGDRKTTMWTMSQSLCDTYKESLLKTIKSNPVVELDKLNVSVQRMYTHNLTKRPWMDKREIEQIAPDETQQKALGKKLISYSAILSLEVQTGTKDKK